MKKYLIIAAAAIATMAACTKVETFDVSNPADRIIRFSVVNHVTQTKGHDLPFDGITYPTNVPFGTFAWWTQNDWTGAASDSTYVFMKNEKVLFNGIEWAPASTYYWTKSGKLTFASYSPYADADSLHATRRAPSDTLGRAASDTLRFAYEDYGYSAVPKYDFQKGFVYKDYRIVSTTDVDLMYADLAANCTENSNSSGSSVTNNVGSDFNGVPTIFNHALCRVGFEVRAIGSKNPNVDSIRVIIGHIGITGMEYKGTFTQNDTVKWKSTRKENENGYSYNFLTDEINLELIPNTDENVAATNNYVEINTRRILLPQEHKDSRDNIDLTRDQKLYVSYTVMIHYTSAPDNPDGSMNWVKDEITAAMRLKYCGIPIWKENQNITYRITINPYSWDKVTFDPAVDPWTDIYSYMNI